MPAGLQVFNADGSLQFDSSTRLTRIIGSIYVNAAGSLTHNELYRGVPFFFITPVRMVSLGDYANYPDVSFGGNTMTWTYAAGTNAANTDCVINYGTY